MKIAQKVITLSFCLFLTSIAVLIVSFGKVTALFAVALSFGSGYFLHYYHTIKGTPFGEQSD
jgi:hypothetical protein